MTDHSQIFICGGPPRKRVCRNKFPNRFFGCPGPPDHLYYTEVSFLHPLVMDKKNSVEEATSRLLWRDDIPRSFWLLVYSVSHENFQLHQHFSMD